MNEENKKPEETSLENEPTVSDAAPKTEVTPAAPAQNIDPKLLGIVAYLTIIGWIIALVLNNPKNENVSFHIRQSLAIMILFIVSGIIMIVPFIGWLVGMIGYLAGLVFWIIGLITAAQGKQHLVPVIGEKAQKWFEAL